MSYLNSEFKMVLKVEPAGKFLFKTTRRALRLGVIVNNLFVFLV